MVVIYPVLELKDIIYAHRYGWLSALTEVTEGIMLRPEAMLGEIFKSGETIKEYLVQEYGLPRELLNKLKIMLDHGINTKGFRNFFGLDKTPRNLVEAYSRLGVDMGIAFDIPARLHLSAAIDIALDGNANVYVDESVRNIIEEIAKIIREQIKDHLNGTSEPRIRQKVRKRAMAIVKDDSNVRDLLVKLSRVSVEETVRRLEEMVEYAHRLGFRGLVPVIQGLFNEDIEYCVKNTIEIMSRFNKEFLIAIGTGGRILSREDVEKIRFAINKIREYAGKNGVDVKIHLLGWSSPNTLWDIDILSNVYSADSLSARRRAVEGRIYMKNEGSIKLIHVKQLNDINCECPVCRDPTLKAYVLDPSGERKNDARIIHNIYVITKFLNDQLKSKANNRN